MGSIAGLLGLSSNTLQRLILTNCELKNSHVYDFIKGSSASLHFLNIANNRCCLGHKFFEKLAKLVPGLETLLMKNNDSDNEDMKVVKAEADSATK